MITATRYHDISCGHRVVGHGGKCALLHGHNYRIHFTVRAVEALDSVGRVLDFSVIKHLLCGWLEVAWDHKTLLWVEDPVWQAIEPHLPHGSIVLVPFNPTAENIAEYLLKIMGPKRLPEGVKLIRVQVDETRKCSATAELLF